MEERRVQVAKLPEPPSMTDVLLNPYESPRIPNHDDDAYDNRPVGRPEHEGLLWLLFSFEGRIPRRVYWGMSILVGVVSGSIELGILLVAGEKLELFVPLATTALAVVRTWIGLAIMAKRWHDRNKSGWMTLILFIPCVGALWMFIELGCLRGTRGENDFGADPT